MSPFTAPQRLRGRTSVVDHASGRDLPAETQGRRGRERVCCLHSQRLCASAGELRLSTTLPGWICPLRRRDAEEEKESDVSIHSASASPRENFCRRPRSREICPQRRRDAEEEKESDVSIHRATAPLRENFGCRPRSPEEFPRVDSGVFAVIVYGFFRATPHTRP
jgi:hypothetical protein